MLQLNAEWFKNDFFNLKIKTNERFIKVFT